MKLVRSTPNKLQCSTIHPISMAHYSDRRFLDPFIAKREMPRTNGEEENMQIYGIYRCYKWRAGGI